MHIAISLDDAIAIQRRHEPRIMAMPGVTGIGVKLRDDNLVLEVTIDPNAATPPDLVEVDQLDGLRLVIERRRYEPQ